jgi:flagellar protein FliO/FliZ
MELLGLVLRVGLSLAVVVGLMWLAARGLRGAVAGRGLGVVEVVARQPLGRGSAVAVVRVADKALVLGVTDTQVTILGETALADVEAARTTTTRTAVNTTAASTVDGTPSGSVTIPGLETTTSGPLAGSILSPQTWRRTVEALRERTVRR